VHEVGNVGNRLKRDLGAVKGASSGRAAGLQLLRAALLTLRLGLVLVLGAARLVENLLDSLKARSWLFSFTLRPRHCKQVLRRPRAGAQLSG
jgi:hypothetical protein